LLVAGVRYYTAGGPLPTTREAQSQQNTQTNGYLAQRSKDEEALLQA